MATVNEYIPSVGEKIFSAFPGAGPPLRWGFSVLWRTSVAIGRIESRRLYPTREAAKIAVRLWVRKNLPPGAKKLERWV